jgi:hypothetical protein
MGGYIVMKKIKLTQLSKDELKRVSGGFEKAGKCSKCGCKRQQSFGESDSRKLAGAEAPR